MRKLVSIFLAGFVLTSMASALTPVKFTTNDGAQYGDYRVQYISVFVDGVKKCYTESHGDCTSIPSLAPGLHKVDYVWANCNNPSVCPHYGEVTQFINVPDTPTTQFVVRIPTARVRWYTKNGVNVSINGGVTTNAVWLGVALGGGTLTKNVMSGCYTASYKLGYAQPIPDWPVIPGMADASLKGFDAICLGAHTTYPTPVPDSGSDTNPPHVRITVPNYWP